MQKQKVKLKATPLFIKIRDAKSRIIVNEGGARSSKTYSSLQYFIADACESIIPKEYDIVRETLPALRATAMKDFYEILKVAGIYEEACENKSERSYILNGSRFNFYSVDEPQKIRGRKRHKVLMNEANEMTLEVFRQLEMRTEEQILLDYNPSEEEHWIYDKVVPRPDCTFIHSTYKDNPFLHPNIVDAIENYEQDDPTYWKIYGLGQRGKRHGLIIQNYDLVSSFPDTLEDILYGIDFGFNDPKVLVRLGRVGKEIWVDELFYNSDTIREDFIKQMKILIPYNDRMKEIYADSEDPESIEVIYREGFNVKPADKGRDSVLSGIEEMMSYHFHITQRSINIIRDIRNYKWKTDKNGKTLDEPIHSFSHGCDAIRYPIHTHWGKSYRNITEADAKNVEIEIMEAISIAQGF